jgi:hypothetical protein
MARSTMLAMTAAAFLLGDPPPTSPAEAIAQARPLLDAAIKAAPEPNKDMKAFRENGDGLRAAHALLKGQSKEGFKQAAFQGAWNEMVTLFNYHGAKPVPDYQLKAVRMASHPIQIGLPVGRGWTYTDLDPGEDQQFWGTVKRTLPNARMVCEIKIWVYRWDTVYSGTGGENAKGLAEGAMGGDREGMKKVSFRSPRIVTKGMSRGFPKTSYYEIVGEDDKLGPVRRRNYYVKGSNTTYNFECIEWRKTEPADDPWTAWQTSGPDPEVEAVLASFEDVGGKK